MIARYQGIGGLLVVAWLTASGCSTNPARVNCEGRLEPINLPAPNAKETSEDLARAADKGRAVE